MTGEPSTPTDAAGTPGALHAYIQAVADVGAHADASATRRDIVESECLYAGTELVKAVETGLEARAARLLGGNGDVVGEIRLLLGAADRTVNMMRVVEARRAGVGGAGGGVLSGGDPSDNVALRTSTNTAAVDILTRPAVSVTRAAGADPKARVSPLTSLPECLVSRGPWEGIVVDRVMKAVLKALQGCAAEADAAGADPGRLDDLGATAGALLDLFRLRGCLEKVVPYCLARPDAFGGGIFAFMSTHTAEQLMAVLAPLPGAYACVRAAVKAVPDDGDAGAARITRCLARLLTSGKPDRKTVEVIVHTLMGVPRGAKPGTHAALGGVAKAVRRAVLTQFGDSRNLPHTTDALCHAAVYFLERTHKDVLQSTSEKLLAPVLQGVSARLGSPIQSHRRMACVAARCLSIVLDPNEPVEFEDFPKAYERWMLHDAKGGWGGADDADAGGDDVRREQAGIRRQQRDLGKAAGVTVGTQDYADECAFGDDDDDDDDDDDGDDATADDPPSDPEPPATLRPPTAKTGPKTAAEAFWSSDDDDDDGNNAASDDADADKRWGPLGKRYDDAAADDGDARGGWRNAQEAARNPIPLGGSTGGKRDGGAGDDGTMVHLQDALKILQGKKENYDEVASVLRGLPLRLPKERLEEVRAVGPQLFHSLLHLSDAFDMPDFKKLRAAALVELLCRIPEAAVRSVVKQVWGANMGTAQRTEALMLLGAAARTLRHHQVVAPDGSVSTAGSSGLGAPGDGDGADGDVDPAALSGVAAIRRRRPYPPLEDGMATSLASAKEVITSRLAAKTKRTGGNHYGAGGPSTPAVVYANRFEKHCGLFVYNLIGTADGGHFNPFTADDPMVALQLVRYLWDVCELLDGCGSALSVEVRRAVLEYLWGAVDHPLPLVLGHILAGAAAAFLSWPTHALDVALMRQWCTLAEEVARGRRGRDDPACRTLAGHLTAAVQTRLDEILDPFQRGTAGDAAGGFPGVKMPSASAPLIEVL